MFFGERAPVKLFNAFAEEEESSTKIDRFVVDSLHLHFLPL